VAGLAFFARLAWRAERAWVKWPGVVLAGLFTAVGALVAILGAAGAYKIYARHGTQAPPVLAASAPARIERGQMLAAGLCAACHSKDGELPLAGGKNLFDEAPMPMGVLHAPNLTPAGNVKEWSDAEVFRILRTGVSRDGRATLMAMIGSRLLSDEDVLSLIAFVRSQPAVQNGTPPFRPSLLLSLFVGAGLMRLDPASADSVAAPARAPNAEYGKYVLDFVSCEGCHGEKLDGRAPPPGEPTPNLTQVLPRWSKDDFFRAMREGTTPDGRKMKDTMPWRPMGKLDDVELEAMYRYLHALNPLPQRSRP
jgi:mono/diheme cytochrome c family protein